MIHVKVLFCQVHVLKEVKYVEIYDKVSQSLDSI